MPEHSPQRPVGPLSAYHQIQLDRVAFNTTWQSSKYHMNAHPATRALIAGIHHQMKRLETLLKHEAKRDADEDKYFAQAASIAADPTANTDLFVE